MVHLDINSWNVMYSPKHCKLVFIDFGFSTIIAEDLGFKTLIGFHGTPEFVSPEMLKLFSLN